MQKKKTDIIILDIKMPGMEALECVMSEYPNIKVIMCSAIYDKAVIDSTIILGVSGYITKPFLPETIIASLKMISIY